MPRTSHRTNTLRRLIAEYNQSIAAEVQWEIVFRERPDRLLTDRTLAIRATILMLQRRRYLERSPYRATSFKKFREILYGDPDFPDDINSSRYQQEFLFNYRVDTKAFWDLHEKIKQHPVFEQSVHTLGRQQGPSEYQLLVLLKYLGSQGTAASNKSLASHFRIGIGTALLFRKRALTAVLALETSACYWPDAAEREEISSSIASQWDFHNCVGFMDGTLLPLEFKPTLHGQVYYCRKGFYAINMLVVCDHVGRITYYVLGWPGSVHDNRVWRTCRLNTEPAAFFAKKEYLLTDSAYVPGPNLVPAFKSCAGQEMVPNHVGFNKLLSKPRVTSEHCIGLMKGRFPWLKNIRIKIRDERSLSKIIEYVRAVVILHNALLAVPFLPDWLTDKFSPLDDDDELNQAIDAADINAPGDTRRSQVLAYFAELGVGGII